MFPPFMTAKPNHKVKLVGMCHFINKRMVFCFRITHSVQSVLYFLLQMYTSSFKDMNDIKLAGESKYKTIRRKFL